MNDRVNKVGVSTQDNLIAKLFPPAETFGVIIPAGAGKLERGTVLELTSDGKYAVLGTTAAAQAEETGGAPTVTAEANCVLAEPVDATTAQTTGVAYCTGHLNRNALVVASGYTITKADIESLRKGGILLSDMM